MPERNSFWRSPRIAWAIACFPWLYVLYLWWTAPSNSNFTRAEQLEYYLTLILPAAVPFWLTAVAWRLEPSRAVRWLAACVVVLGEVMLGFWWLSRWWVVTVTPPNGSSRSVVLELVVSVGVLLVQGVFAVLSLLVAVMAYQDRQMAARRTPQRFGSFFFHKYRLCCTFGRMSVAFGVAPLDSLPTAALP